MIDSVSCLWEFRVRALVLSGFVMLRGVFFFFLRLVYILLKLVFEKILCTICIFDS